MGAYVENLDQVVLTNQKVGVCLQELQIQP
jgi:hypothetical protein